MSKIRVLLTGVFSFIFLLVSVNVFAEGEDVTTGWKKTLIVDLTTTQSAYSDSWTGGEEGSFNWVSNLNGAAEKQLKEWFDFKSTLRLSFGQTVTQDADTKDWGHPKKSTDLIDWENVGRFTMHKVVDPYVAFRVESQFVDASRDTLKRYLSPLTLTESVGFTKKLFEQDKNSVISRFGAALRQHISKDILTRQVINGVDTTTEEYQETNTIIDGGFEWVTDATYQFNEKLKYTGKLTVFKALYNSKEDELETDYWKAVDVNWENTINAYISKIITVNLYTQLLYNKDISKKGRFKETLGIGFVFKMI